MTEISQYDPNTDTITLRLGASLYERFHEQAHQDQYKSAIWRFLIHARGLRFVNYLVTLWIEYDALRRARTVMEKLGIWTDDAEQEARRMFFSYVRRKELTQ